MLHQVRLTAKRPGLEKWREKENMKLEKMSKTFPQPGKQRISWQCRKVSPVGAAPFCSLHCPSHSTLSPSVPVYYDLAGARAALCGV